ncbi:MAG: DUF3365 domain-containing protein [Planctomycetales bacterium]|nr:DUF3365 domain-containing protein [Planctomycetales bacterium]
MKRMLLGVVAMVGMVVVGFSLVAQDAAKKPSKEAVERTRDTIKMLDDVYKSAVVLITDKYVHSDEDYAAGSATVDLFAAIKAKGWHVAELLDVTGDPYDSENVANDDFEKMAVEKIKQGEAFVEAVEPGKDGGFVLRAMTPVPVVLEKCTMCHEHYKAVAPGAAIGAISYAVPVR